ncbi:MAG: hypothetical protein E6K17_03885 [Methanobacteriota archaeon]|nr:MAG: hypothetical protein E6K17_03885 [Euryarchaeota archaeon]
MLFFDLEFYVPSADRATGKSSMKANPTKAGHILLGGTFSSLPLRAEIPVQPKLDGYWIWNYDKDEVSMMREIKARFELEWQKNAKEKEWVLKKPVEDLVVCGAGISRFDLPALYCRGVLHQLAPPDELFDLFLKCKTIDLANVGSFLFPEDKTLYPKTTREMAGRLGIAEQKGSSKGVWATYDEGDFNQIQARTDAEVTTVMRIYSQLHERVSKLGSASN